MLECHNILWYLMVQMPQPIPHTVLSWFLYFTFQESKPVVVFLIFLCVFFFENSVVLV